MSQQYVSALAFKGNDSLKVAELLNLAFEYRFMNADSAADLVDAALKLAEKRKSKRQIATAENIRGLVLASKGEYDQAISCHEKAIKIFQELKLPAEECKGWHNLGFQYQSKGESKQAISAFEKAGDLAKAAGNTKVFYFNNTYLGRYLLQQGEYEKGLRILLAVLSQAEREKLPLQVINAENAIGEAFQELGQTNKAIDYYMQGLRHAEELKDTAMISQFCNNLGIGYERTNQLQKAESHYLRSLQLKERLNDLSRLAVSYTNLGAFYDGKKKDRDKAEFYFKRALDCDLKINNEEGLSYDYLNLADLYLTRKEYSRALEMFAKAEPLARKYKSNELMVALYHIGANAYSKTNNYQKAFEYMVKKTEFQDSVHASGSARLASEIEGKFQNEKKQLMIEKYRLQQSTDSLRLAQQTSENRMISRQKKTQTILFSGAVLALAAITFFIWRGLRAKQRANRIITMQKEAVEQQRNQIANQKAEIETQKLLVEEKNKEVLDSIRYAKRIQVALITSERYIHKTLSRLKKN